MLNHAETLIISKGAAALAACKCADHGALAAELMGAVANAAQARLAMSEAASARVGTGKRGAPRKLYRVDCEPLWSGVAEGVQQAADMVNEVLRKERMAEVSTASIQQGLARYKAWSKMVETDNGTVVLTVTKAPETGTDLASAQSEHKSETNPELGTTERKRRSRK